MYVHYCAVNTTCQVHIHGVCSGSSGDGELIKHLMKIMLAKIWDCALPISSTVVPEHHTVVPVFYNAVSLMKKLFVSHFIKLLYNVPPMKLNCMYSTTCHKGHLCKEDTCSMGTANPNLFKLECCL